MFSTRDHQTVEIPLAGKRKAEGPPGSTTRKKRKAQGSPSPSTADRIESLKRQIHEVEGCLGKDDATRLGDGWALAQAGKLDDLRAKLAKLEAETSALASTLNLPEDQAVTLFALIKSMLWDKLDRIRIVRGGAPGDEAIGQAAPATLPQIKTPAFAEFFGDWQGLRAQQDLDGMTPIECPSRMDGRT